MKNSWQIAIFALVFLSACGTGEFDFLSAEQDGLFGDLANFNGNASTTVCNPFEDPGFLGEPNKGLAANLFTILPEARSFTQATQWTDLGELTPYGVFFTYLFAPERDSVREFITLSGDVASYAGNPIRNRFGLRIGGRIAHQTGDPGNARIQLGLISNDGSVLRLAMSSGMEPYIDNDGVHGSKMACAPTAMPFTDGTEIPFVIDYFSGNDYSLSLNLVARLRYGKDHVNYFPGSDSLTDALCGAEAQAIASAFGAHFDDLKTNGAENLQLSSDWQVVPPRNLLLPQSISENPCHADPSGNNGGIGV